MTDYESNRFLPNERAKTQWDMDKTIIWDVEAHNWKDPLAIGVLLPNGEYREFTDEPIRQFGNFALKSRYRNHKFVCHNGGGYDHGFILDYLTDEEYCNDVYDFEVLQTNGKLFYIKVWDEQDKPRTFQDSLKLMPRGLESLADSFADVSKLSPDHVDIADLPPTLTQLSDREREELSEYLKRDCVALRQCLESFSEIVADLTNESVGPQITVGSTALEVYRCHFMDKEDVRKGIQQPPEHLEEPIRESYYGGRTEVFRQRAYRRDDGKKYRHYDVNSLFPHCYTNFKLPTGKPVHVEEPDKSDIDIMDMDENGGFVRITGHVECDSIPVLPNRYQPPEANSEKVLFPSGPITGWYSLREVKYAVEIGQLKDLQIEEAIICKLQYAFQEYGESLYELKSSIDKQKNPARYKVVKFLLNSLYGKWGMAKEQTSIHRKDPDGDEWPPEEGKPLSVSSKQRARKLWYNHGVHQKQEQSDAQYIIPRISSAITAQARIEMHKWFRRVQELGGKVYYCDTDSIVTDVELPDQYVNEELGMMDMEGLVHQAVFCRPKTYAEIIDGGDNTIKGKGMRDIATKTEHNPQPLTAAGMIQAFDNNNPEKISSTWFGPEGIKQSLYEQGGGISVRQFERSLSGWDDKRQHLDPETSIPLDMAELWREEVEEEAAERRRKRKAELARAGYETQVSDPHAQEDSTLTARENKQVADRNRKDKAKDYDQRRRNR